jgi:Lrp/AsnC family transcriptional regulator for asnA, asnC and gidA
MVRNRAEVQRNASKSRSARRTVHDLDRLDRSLIEELQANGRQSNAAIGRTLGVTETTIRNRIERLTSEGFIRITAVIDPRCTVYRVNAIIWMRVDRSRATETARRIAAFPNVVYVGHTTGRYDLLVEALFESDEELFAFLTRKLSGSLDIIQSETYHVLRTDKINYDWKLPVSQGAAAGRGGDREPSRSRRGGRPRRRRPGVTTASPA